MRRARHWWISFVLSIGIKISYKWKNKLLQNYCRRPVLCKQLSWHPLNSAFTEHDSRDFYQLQDVSMKYTRAGEKQRVDESFSVSFASLGRSFVASRTFKSKIKTQLCQGFYENSKSYSSLSELSWHLHERTQEQDEVCNYIKWDKNQTITSLSYRFTQNTLKYGSSIFRLLYLWVWGIEHFTPGWSEWILCQVDF